MRAAAAAAGLAIVLAASGLAGCGVLGSAPQADPAGDRPPTAAPLSAPTLLPVPQDTVAATGIFDGSGGVTGKVAVVRTADAYRLDFSDMTVPEDGFSLTLLSEVPSPSDRCPAPYWALSPGGEVGSGSTTVELPPFGEAGEDPSYLAVVELAQERGASRGAPGCSPWTVGGAALLHWTLPDLRPDLRPGDTGPRAAATGEVVDGRYWIASGDTWAAIATRFGLTSEGLAYLNPVSWWAAKSRWTQIEAGCTLNVDKAHRGGTTRCTWQP